LVIITQPIVFKHKFSHENVIKQVLSFFPTIQMNPGFFIVLLSGIALGLVISFFLINKFPNFFINDSIVKGIKETMKYTLDDIKNIKKNYPTEMFTEDEIIKKLEEEFHKKTKNTLSMAESNCKKGTKINRIKSNIDYLFQPVIHFSIFGTTFYVKSFQGSTWSVFTKEDYEKVKEFWKKSIDILDISDDQKSNLNNCISILLNSTKKTHLTNDQIILKVEELFQENGIENQDFYYKNYLEKNEK